MSTAEKERVLNFKICFLGAQGVGKTSVAVRCVSDTFRKSMTPTIGASFFKFTMTVDNFNVRFQIWDTAGQERFRAMTPLYYRKAQAAILVYDVTSCESFQDIRSWVHDLHNHLDEDILLCLMGNKCDLIHMRIIEQEKAEQFAEALGALHFETSALNKEGIEEAFIAIAKRLIQIHLEAERRRPKPSSFSSSITVESPKKKKMKWFGCCPW